MPGEEELVYPTRREEGESIEELKRRQRKVALELANIQRKRMAVMKTAIRKRVLDDTALVRGSLDEWEPLIKEWRVLKLLKACRAIGDTRAFEILEVAEVRPRTRMRELSWSKRDELARLVEQARDPAHKW